MPDSVLYEVTGRVATITLNRPDALNSLTAEAKQALREAVDRAREDTAVRAVVLTGTGRAFCVGQDLREHAANLASGKALDGTLVRHYNPVIAGLAGMPKPVIAAVNGVAAGAGASLTFACDLRIASQKASFTTAFTGIGLAPDSGMSWTLQRLVGYAKAAELLLLAEPVTAEDAARLGLVHRVVPADELSDAARDLAERLAAGPTRAYAAVKEALAYASGTGLAEALEKEAELQDALAASTDHTNATEAFLKKERPTFTGH